MITTYQGVRLATASKQTLRKAGKVYSAELRKAEGRIELHLQFGLHKEAEYARKNAQELEATVAYIESRLQAL